MNKEVIGWVCIIALCILTISVLADGETRSVTDGRGITMEVPADIQRVVCIDDGLAEQVMYSLGVDKTLVGVGSTCLQQDWKVDVPKISGSNITMTGGMNTFSSLRPDVKQLPLVAQYNSPPNFEMIAELKPDVVIIRPSDCTFYTDESTMKQTIDTIESLEIPVFVTYGPNSMYGCTDCSDISTIDDEIRLLGKLFAKETDANKLATYLEQQRTFVQERTKDIPDTEKPSVLVLGLSPKTRGEGSAADVWGIDTIEGIFLEQIVNAKNAYQNKGHFVKLNTEQILALEPDVILLATDWGFHPVEELYSAPYYQDLAKNMEAIKNQKVTSLPWLPCNCDKRIEYPIELMVMAKAAYPDKFTDINLNEWLISFYKNIYNVDDKTADQLISAQWMDWVRN